MVQVVIMVLTIIIKIILSARLSNYCTKNRTRNGYFKTNESCSNEQVSYLVTYKQMPICFVQQYWGSKLQNVLIFLFDSYWHILAIITSRVFGWLVHGLASGFNYSDRQQCQYYPLHYQLSSYPSNYQLQLSNYLKQPSAQWHLAHWGRRIICQAETWVNLSQDIRSRQDLSKKRKDVRR